MMGRRSALLLLFAAALAVVAVAGGGLGTKSARATSWYEQLPTIQKRILSGFASYEIGPNVGFPPRTSSGGDEEEGGDEVEVTTTPLLKRATCPQDIGKNIVVNQNCLNLADADLQGRSRHRTRPRSRPIRSNPPHVVASYNDYRRGDGTAASSYSLNGGSDWSRLDRRRTASPAAPRSAASPASTGRPAATPRSRGTPRAMRTWSARCSCAAPRDSNNPDQSSAIYVFRSTGNDGASWNFPGSPVAEYNDFDGRPAPPPDKPYMTVDNHVGSPFQDRVYVTWTFFDADGTGYIYGAYSDDYGADASARRWSSSTTSRLCANNYGLPTPHGNCNENQFSDPFVGPDGALYVVYANFNNAVTGNENWNQILLTKSTDGGKTFGEPVLVTKYYDLPDCSTYQGHQTRAAPAYRRRAASMNSVFRATNFASAGAVNPTTRPQVAVTVGSYINMNSNEKQRLPPGGFAGDGINLYDGVKTARACNNEILVSVSNRRRQTSRGRHRPAADGDRHTGARPGARPTSSGQWSAFTGTALAVSYYDRQYGNDETTGYSDFSVSASRNLTTFGTVRASSSSMPLPTQFPNSVGNSQFFGDYTGLTISEGRAFPVWPDTRNDDLFLCDGTGKKGVPPELCNGTEPNGLKANDQQIYVAGVDLP